MTCLILSCLSSAILLLMLIISNFGWYRKDKKRQIKYDTREKEISERDKRMIDNLKKFQKENAGLIRIK